MSENNGASHQRPYIVCRVNDGKLAVLKAAVKARTQEHACDLVVQVLPPAERNGTFAAFLAASYREFTYESEQKVVTTKRRRAPSFGGASVAN